MAGRRHNPHAVRPVLIGDVGVLAEARIGAIASIDFAGSVPASRRAEVLPVGGGCGAVAPDGGDRHGTADEAAHRVVLVTKARELRGRGTAQATIESSLHEADGRTQVEIVTELNLQGSVAQYGRGLVPEIAAQLTKQFADNVASLLEREQESPAGEPPSAIAAR